MFWEGNSGCNLKKAKNLLPNLGLLLATRKSILERQVLVEKKTLLLIRKPGEGGLSIPENRLPRFCSAMKVLKGMGEVMSLRWG